MSQKQYFLTFNLRCFELNNHRTKNNEIIINVMLDSNPRLPKTSRCEICFAEIDPHVLSTLILNL